MEDKQKINEIIVSDDTIYAFSHNNWYYTDGITSLRRRKMRNDRTIDVCTDWRDDKQPGAISACNIL